MRLNRSHYYLCLAGAIAFGRPAGALAVPDVVTSSIDTAAFYGVDGAIASYSLSTTACNIGDVLLPWFDVTNQHPVIAQNLYRLKAGRFEQIGMAWVKHGWCAADGTNCVAAGGPPVCNWDTTCDWLGVGCTDTYGTISNAYQPSLGPRSEVNASTGYFPYPYILGWDASGTAIYKRLQTLIADVHPADNPGALYCVESHYVHPADAAPAGGNPYNNASYRQAAFSAALSPSLIGPTVPQQPAIMFWATQDPLVQLASVDVPNDGRFWLGSRAYDNGNGTHTYEYALFNLNSHRSAGLFSVDVGGASVSAIGFHDVAYHSGEPYDGADWPAVISGCVLQWAATPHASNPDANALRWGTLYNFRFTADAPPAAGSIDIGLFRPGGAGEPAAVSIAARVPSVPTLCPCTGDLDGNSTRNGQDIALFTAQYLGNAPVTACAAELAAPTCVLNSADLAAFVAQLLQPDPACP